MALQIPEKWPRVKLQALVIRMFIDLVRRQILITSRPPLDFDGGVQIRPIRASWHVATTSKRLVSKSQRLGLVRAFPQ